MRLHEWQAGLQQNILSGQTVCDLPLREGAVSAARQLAVYQAAYRLRLVEALASNYPALYALLGQAQFEQLGFDYLVAYPSAAPSIRWFGGRLADWLTRQSPYAQLPVLAELARFEWALRGALDAADAPVLPVAALAGLAPEDWAVCRLRLQPSACAMHLHWNVPALWQALLAEQVPPGPEAQAGDWLIWRRPDGMVVWRSLATDEAWALATLAAGSTLASVCEGLTDWQSAEQVPLRLVSLLQGWLAEGLLRAD